MKIQISCFAQALSHTSPGFYVSAVQVFFETLWEKEKSSFPTVFSTLLETFLPFSLNLELLTANPFSLEDFKICSFGRS